MNNHHSDHCQQNLASSSPHNLLKKLMNRNNTKVKKNPNLNLSQEDNRTDTCSPSSKLSQTKNEVDYSFFCEDSIPHNLFGSFIVTPSELIDPFNSQPDSRVYSYCSFTSKKASQQKERPDIQRRKMLRSMKRFYYELFKYLNNKFFYLRLKRVVYSTVIKALENLCAVYISKTHAEQMAQFMFKFLNIKCASCTSAQSEAFKSGKKVYNCTYNYSISKFDSLFESEHFRILLLSYSGLQQSSPLCLQEMKSKQQWPNRFDTHDGSYLRLIYKHLRKGRMEKSDACLKESVKRCQYY
ncbi:unnamed protein product [Moneuplotes crassus]|uniref:Uncharacterized protein n=1 Tax=Euplotes crassus TaxID=5936 RepID=A0AAD1XZF7_EUPCR|nr:unnamed protein product [Moneuplotes crassus]